MNNTISRILDTLGWAAAAAPAMIPAAHLHWWVLLICGAVSYGCGKASQQGVPFRGTTKDEPKGTP